MNSLFPTNSDSVYLLSFMLFVGSVVFPVGALALRLFQIKPTSRLEYLLFILISGTLFSNALYFALRLTNLEQLSSYVFFCIFIFSVILFSLSAQRRSLLSWRRPGTESLIFFAVTLLIGFYHFHRTWHAITWIPDGGLIFRQGFYADPIWKLSVASELEHSVPPQMPIFAGSRMTYHYAMELFTVFVHSSTRIDLISLRFFIIPIYGFLTMSLAVFTCFKHFLKNSKLALFALVMIMVSWYGCTDDAHMSFAIATYLAVIMFICHNLTSKKLMGWLLIALCIGQTMMYEAMVSATFLGGLFIAALLFLVWKKRAEPLLTISMGGALIIIVQNFCVGRVAGGSGQQIISIDFPLFVYAVKDFTPLKETLRNIAQAYRSQPIGGWHLTQFLQIAALPFLGAAAFLKVVFYYYNIGLLALPLLWTKIKDLKNQSISLMLILPVLAFGTIFPLIFSISFLWAASFRILTITVLLLIGFVPLAIQTYWTRSKFHKIAIILMIAAFFIGPALHLKLHYYKNSSLYGEVTAHEMQLFDFLRSQTSPEAVLMHPFMDHDVRDSKRNGAIAWVFKDHYYLGSALGGRRVVLEGSKQGIIKESTKLTQPQIDKILNDIATVYTTADEKKALEILQKYHVSFLWVPKSKSLRFQHEKSLKKVVENPDHTLYQVLTNPA